MRIDSEVIRDERRRRGWSQPHLATVSGLGLRTIQRIERDGSASYESAMALASCFELPLARLLPPETGPEPNSSRFVKRGTAVLGMAASFAAGALLMTMQGAVAEDLFVEVGVTLFGFDGEYRTQVSLVDGEKSEFPLPGTHRLAILPEILDDGSVMLNVELFDDGEEPNRLIAGPRLVIRNGSEAIVGAGTEPASEGSYRIALRPLLLDLDVPRADGAPQLQIAADRDADTRTSLGANRACPATSPPGMTTVCGDDIPIATAYQSLFRLAIDRGEADGATEYFKRAAGLDEPNAQALATYVREGMIELAAFGAERTAAICAERGRIDSKADLGRRRNARRDEIEAETARLWNGVFTILDEASGMKLRSHAADSRRGRNVTAITDEVAYLQSSPVPLEDWLGRFCD